MLQNRAAVIALAIALTPMTLPAGAQPASPADVEKEDFFKEELAPVRKDPGYNLTIVYFMDYQCPACRQYTPDVAKALSEDRKLRVIYRDTPLLGPRSDAAARAAIASQFQGKHEAFHHALMTVKLPLDELALESAARKAGLDWERLQSDLSTRSDEIDRQILTNMMLSTATGISGTPAFIIGNRLSNGALKYEDLRAEIADARKELGVTAAGEPPSSEPPADNSEVADQDVTDNRLERAFFEGAPSGPENGSRQPLGRSYDLWTPGAAAVGGLAILLLGWLAVRRRSGRSRQKRAF